ncbi:uncharacterized protein BYT42DRAFT_567380 [Radiomyces spectabilis]|uniref:uncharacterized protein n=1 Tax=Radiomyces spectabilis TaxID=64574 RepID=UPI002220D2EC|nr:uncharacterized protein BYT42DRAFT_567380 [Radiomyces spectabilis]KAI8379080.1 hypothetical protein BYT42DRAFT_567380 [Radiomyces spectabilis]
MPVDLPIDDATLNPVQLDIFQPLPCLAPYDLSEILRLTAVAASPIRQPAHSDKPASSARSDNLYCTACKKKFKNEATWQSHLKSAKHLANEKAAKHTAAVSKTNVAKSDSKAGTNPEIQALTQKLKQVSKMTSSNPSAAVSQYWGLSQAFYTHKRPHDTKKALLALIELLKSASISGMGASQINSTLYLARLALARLSCLYHDLDTARLTYLAAIEDKWKIDQKQLLNAAMRACNLPVRELMEISEQLASRYIDREKKRTEPAKPVSNPNYAISPILFECACLFAQEAHSLTVAGVPYSCEKIALVLFHTAAAVCCYENKLSQSHLLWIVSQIYDQLNARHLGCDARMLYIECAMKDGDSSPSSDLLQNMFSTLLTATELDDYTRMKSVSLQIRKMLKEHFDGATYDDLQILEQLGLARQNLDYVALENLAHEVDHMELLLEQGSGESILHRCSADQRLNILDRLNSLLEL